jgi:predicted transcriptional regulator
MGSMTIRVPDELKKRMDKQGKLNWSEVARSAFEEAIIKEERQQAIEKIKKIQETDKDNWDGVEEIRKWRQRHE